MGKCCVAGCGAININEIQKYFTVNDLVVKEGDYITLNGTTGEVILGEAPLVTPALTGDFGIFMKWVDEFRKLGVRTNADTPHDSEVARKFRCRRDRSVQDRTYVLCTGEDKCCKRDDTC